MNQDSSRKETTECHPTEKICIIGESWWAVKIDDVLIVSLYKTDSSFSLKKKTAEEDKEKTEENKV